MSKLYIIGTGLASDLITLRAIEVLKRVKRVFIEQYTGLLMLNENVKEILKGKKVRKLSRRDLEDLGGKEIFDSLKDGDVAILVPGDPLVATTHTSIVVEAYKRGYKVEVIPGISIIPNALTMAGLMIYKMGKPVTLVYPKEGIIYDYPYDVIKDNDSRNLHTVLLLELDMERNVVMKVNEAIDILFMMEDIRKEGVVKPTRKGVAVAALGSKNQIICFNTLENLKKLPINEIPQTLIITSPKLHFMEEEMLKVMNNEYCKPLK